MVPDDDDERCRPSRGSAMETAPNQGLAPFTYMTRPLRGQCNGFKQNPQDACTCIILESVEILGDAADPPSNKRSAGRVWRVGQSTCQASRPVLRSVRLMTRLFGRLAAECPRVHGDAFPERQGCAVEGVSF